MKVFISQAMYGRTDEEIIAERAQAKSMIELLYGKDTEIIDSFIKDEPPKDVNKGLWYLSKSIELLAGADRLIEINDASRGYRPRGCGIEHECAIRYGIPISVLTFTIKDENKQLSILE